MLATDAVFGHLGMFAVRPIGVQRNVLYIIFGLVLVWFSFTFIAARLH